MGLPYKDTQCGFKAFKRAAAQVIFRLQTIERWGFDPEILFIARKLGYTIVEVPVTWGHDERSRISLPQRRHEDARGDGPASAPTPSAAATTKPSPP